MPYYNDKGITIVLLTLRYHGHSGPLIISNESFGLYNKLKISMKAKSKASTKSPIAVLHYSNESSCPSIPQIPNVCCNFFIPPERHRISETDKLGRGLQHLKHLG